MGYSESAGSAEFLVAFYRSHDMDPLSHALLGAASAQSVFRGRRGLAAVAGALGALLPDADVLIRSDTDPLVALEFHRQFTHSLPAAPLGAVIVAGAICLLMRRRVGFAQLYWPALIGYVSALLLDACTSYGTQLLWPFTERRFAASVVAVIDPVVTLVLLVGFVLALKWRAARPARAAVTLVVLYLGLGWVQRERAESLVARAAADRGHAIAVHEVKPTLGNIVLWRSVYLTGNDYVVDAVRAGIVSGSTLYPGASARRVRPVDLVPPLRPNSVQANDVVRFARVSEGFLVRHPSDSGVIGDVRYSIVPNSTRPLWGIEIQPEREEHHVVLRTFREHSRADRELFFAMLRGVPPTELRLGTN